MASNLVSDLEPLTPFNVRQWLSSHTEESIPSIKFSQPVQLGKGWTKANKIYSYNDASGLPALSPNIPTPFNLNDNMDAYIPKEAGDKGYIEDVIAAARAANASLDSCDVLTYRNNLNKLFGTPFDTRAAWKIDACFHGATLFLDIVKDEPKEWDNSEEARRMTAWGYQFEAKCTGEPAGNANNEYGMLVKTQLGDDKLTLYIGAEIDAYDGKIAQQSLSSKPAADAGASTSTSNNINDGNSPPPMESLCELKTYKLPAHRGQWRTLYRFKHPKWWLQSFLAGVSNLVLGERDDQGIVRAINRVRVNDLPKISWQNGERWNPQQALAFGASTLAWMRGVAQQSAGHHLRFEYEPQAGIITCTVVTEGDLPERICKAMHPDE